MFWKIANAVLATMMALCLGLIVYCLWVDLPITPLVIAAVALAYFWYSAMVQYVEVRKEDFLEKVESMQENEAYDSDAGIDANEPVTPAKSSHQFQAGQPEVRPADTDTGIRRL